MNEDSMLNKNILMKIESFSENDKKYVKNRKKYRETAANKRKAFSLERLTVKLNWFDVLSWH